MTADHPDPLERTLQPYYNQGGRNGPIVVDDWAGAIPQTRAQLPSVRIGRRWFSSLWLVPLGALALVLSIAVVREMARHPWFGEFIARYPGTSAAYVEPVDSGFPWWLRWQHFFNLLFMMFIIRAGLQILADHPRLYFNSGSRPDSEWMRLRGPVPADRRDSADADTVWTAKEDSVALPKNLGIPGFRHSIGLARWWHFSFDLLWLINGVVFMVLLFSTDQWKRLIPRSMDVFPNALSTALQYLSLQLPQNAGFSSYNALQLLAYFITVFIAAPLAFVTGLLQAPSIAARFSTGGAVPSMPDKPRFSSATAARNVGDIAGACSRVTLYWLRYCASTGLYRSHRSYPVSACATPAKLNSAIASDSRRMTSPDRRRHDMRRFSATSSRKAVPLPLVQFRAVLGSSQVRPARAPGWSRLSPFPRPFPRCSWAPACLCRCRHARPSS